MIKVVSPSECPLNNEDKCKICLSTDGNMECKAVDEPNAFPEDCPLHGLPIIIRMFV